MCDKCHESAPELDAFAAWAHHMAECQKCTQFVVNYKLGKLPKCLKGRMLYLLSIEQTAK